MADDKDKDPRGGDDGGAPTAEAERDENPTMSLMQQAVALQHLSAQATAQAMQLPKQRLDTAHDEPLTQVFEMIAPDGSVMARVNANGEPVKGSKKG